MKKLELQYLAGVINENQYHELFGFETSSKKPKEINYGQCLVSVNNHTLNIKSTAQDLVSHLYYYTIDKKIELSNDQLDQFVHMFKNDIKKSELDMFKERGVPFQMKLVDVMTKLVGNSLLFDDQFSTCFNFRCKLELTPSQLEIMKKVM